MLALAGIADTAPRQGMSLVPLLEGQSVPWRSSILLEDDTDQVFPRMLTMEYQAVRTERNKDIHYLELSGADELYDLQADPFEMDKLIATDAGRRLLPDLTAELARLQRESEYRRDFRGYRSPSETQPHPTAAELQDLQDCLCLALRRTTRIVTQRYDAALRPFGIRVTQLPILTAAASGDGVPLTPLAEGFGMDWTTLLRNVRPLARRGLVDVRRAVGHRHDELHATAKGRALLRGRTRRGVECRTRSVPKLGAGISSDSPSHRQQASERLAGLRPVVGAVCAYTQLQVTTPRRL